MHGKKKHQIISLFCLITSTRFVYGSYSCSLCILLQQALPCHCAVHRLKYLSQRSIIEHSQLLLFPESE